MHRKEIKFIITYLDINREQLDASQYEFLVTLKKQFNTTGVLTEKQSEFLNSIKEYIPSAVPLN
jgi:hypothetical protein